jgi:D-alanyl-D-alanine carboxypeptidase
MKRTILFLITISSMALAGCSQPNTAPAVPATVLASVDRPPIAVPPELHSPVDAKTPAVQVVENLDPLDVLVNKRFALPAGYRPGDLVEPDVPFIFDEPHEKRLMRKEAAHALALLFAAAREDGIYLAGVSGYRSYETQEWLFDYNVTAYGEEYARKYVAEPGHSEHQTGLAMDVSGSTGECAADDCFADTTEARWLADHAGTFGFIIRYPQGKESITGYNYEPWHLRYVGAPVSRAIAASGLTLEEYLNEAG